MSDQSKARAGRGVAIALGLIFVVLKLTNVIDWSWWFVTMPFWIGLAALSLSLIVMLVVASIVVISNSVKGKK